jgi:hypothetical protein
MRGQSASLALKPEQRSELERVRLSCSSAFQIPQENLVKERWWRALEAGADLETLRAGVEALPIPEVWKDCLRERLLID